MSNLATIVNNILADSGIDDINVVVTTGSYSNPAWITALAWTKITGAPTFVTNVTATSPLFSSGGTTPNITIQQSSSSLSGFLSSTDWNTFNNKANANGSNASGTWPISITGSAGSVAFNNLTDKTGGTGTYQTSGSFRAPIFYDSDNPGYFLDPNDRSNLNAISLGAYTQHGVYVNQPADNFGNGRFYLRIHPTANGPRIISFKMIVSSTWNYAPSFGFITADVSFYFDGSAFYNATTIVTSATGDAAINLAVGNPVIESGYVSVPVFSVNTNAISIKLEGTPQYNWADVTYSPWVSVAFPGTVTTTVPNKFSVGGVSTFNSQVTISTSVDGQLTLRNPTGQPNEWNYIEFVLSSGARRSYFGLDSSGTPVWYNDTTNTYINLGSTATVNGTQIVTNAGTWGINITGNAATATSAGNADTVDGLHASDFARWAFVGQSNINSIKAPGLYEYDPIPTGTPPVQSPNIRTIEIGKDSRYTQVAFPFDSDNMYFRRQYNTDWLPWLTVLHSGNFNSYAPTLTGTGASGTWGINVTGSAGYTQTLALTSLGNGSVNVNNPNTAVYRNENGLGAALPYAPVLNVSGGDTMWQAQGSYGTSGNGTLYFRQGFNGSWGNWLTMLSSSNFSSYALPIVGGTLTGLLTIETLSDFKLRLRVPSGDTSQWNYIEFNGSDGVRDAYFGTDGGGVPTWYNDATGTYITLGSTATVNGTQIVTNSGTWGISITGSASSATTFNGLNFNGLNTRFTGDLNTLGLSSTSGIYNIGAGYTNGPLGDLYGTLFGIWNSDISVQFWATYNGDFYWRKSVGGSYTGAPWRTILDSSNFSSYAVQSRVVSNWNDGTVINNVIGMLGWKNYGGNHVIFDASASTSPSGSAINNTNSQNAWGATYPTLMGWNGNQTFGVRVDSARISDNTSGNSATTSQTNFSNLTINSAQVLSAGNFTNYTIRFNSTSAYANGLNNTTVVPNSVTLFDGYAAPVPNYPPATSQYWVGALTIGNDSRGFQIAGGYSDNEMYFRKGADTWQTWRRTLNDVNFNEYAPTLTGGGASGTWNINVSGSANVAFNNLTSKTGGTGTYQTSGDFRAPIFYDSVDSGYYVDPNGFSNIAALSTGGGYTQFGTSVGGPASNFGNGRIYMRVHPTSSGARIISFKMTIGSTWNWAPAFGYISADVSFYFDGSSLFGANTTVTSATGYALGSLALGAPVIENGYVSIPIYSVNTNSIFVNIVGSPSFNWGDVSWSSWSSVSFPGAVTVNVPGAFSVGGNLSVSGSSSFTNPVTISTSSDGQLTLRAPAGDPNEWNYINFNLTNNVRRAYFGLDGSGTPNWYRDDNGVNVSLTSVFAVSGGVSSSGNIIAGSTSNNSQRRIHANVTLSQNNGIYIGSINDTSPTGYYSIDFPGWRDNNTNPICARIAAVAKWNCCNGYPSTGYAGVRGLDLVFYTNTGWSDVEPVERMRILDSGNIGINQASPTATLDVNGSGKYSGSVTINAGGDNLILARSSFTSFQLGLGTANSINGFHITIIGGSTFMSVNQSNGATTFTSSVTATSFFESSDSRIKELVSDNHKVNGVELIKPKLYKKNGKVELGYYAQDFQDILPHAVLVGEDGYLSLSYREIHTAKIAYLEDSIEEIKAKILYLEQQLKNKNNENN
jgi:hypothetical protein